MDGAPLARLRAAAEAAGMTSLAAAGGSRVRDGVTSFDELLRVVGA
jgi:type II secretory ATPase GspE/PulE/Tfp pilus assembly ATPase PilB-like protein